MVASSNPSRCPIWASENPNSLALRQQGLRKSRGCPPCELFPRVRDLALQTTGADLLFEINDFLDVGKEPGIDPCQFMNLGDPPSPISWRSEYKKILSAVGMESFFLVSSRSLLSTGVMDVLKEEGKFILTIRARPLLRSQGNANPSEEPP